MIALTIALFGAMSMGQQGPTSLYAPAKTVKDQKIELRGWGSGTIAESQQAPFLGENSLRVSSRNFFQGGTLAYEEPKDLHADFEDKSKLLRVTFFLEDAGVVYGVNGKGSVKGTGVGDRVNQHAVVPSRSGVKVNSADLAVPFKPKIKTIRLVILTTDEKKSEIYVPIMSSQAEGQGWRSISVPIQAISGFDRTNKVVKQISLSTDTIGTFYVGEMKVAQDEAPISAKILNESNLSLALGDKATFNGYGEGGSSVLVYRWDFDDRDGIQVDAEGQTVIRKFRKAGTFNVTLTVSDKYELKKPAIKTLIVTVNP